MHLSSQQDGGSRSLCNVGNHEPDYSVTAWNTAVIALHFDIQRTVHHDIFL